MSYRFRNNLLNEVPKLKELMEDLLNKKEIEEFDEEIWSIIGRDKTPIRINGEPLAFKDLFHLDLNEGRCKNCAIEFLLLLDKIGIYSEAVECINENFKGSKGSTYGGHWYLEIKKGDNIKCIDTSLVITGTPLSFEKLGHKVVRRLDIDTIFKENPGLIDYYDNMIINKHGL